jgi:hypothetical protein
MKRLFTITLALIMAVTLAACNNPESETDFTRAEDNTAETANETTTKKADAEKTSADEAVAEPAFAEEAVAEPAFAGAEAEFANEAGGETTTAAETTTKTDKQEHAICGTYRSVLPAYPLEEGELEEIMAGGEDYMLYDYIDISHFDDGRFQVELRLAIGGSGNDFAIFDTEALGTSDWYSYYFDGSNDVATPNNNGAVTVTADGATAWVAFEGGEAYEFTRVE